MNKEDIAQVNEIDREAFPTQWPPPNYRHELQNQLARYIVVYNDEIKLAEPEEQPENETTGIMSKIMQRFRLNLSSSEGSALADKQYIVGFAGIWVLADEAHITNLAVRKKCQRRGIGERLLIATIDLAREMKASMMTLEVRASNLIAQNLYRKYGFTEVGIRRGYYTDNREDGILMSTENITSNSFQARLQQLREALEGRGS